MPDLAVKSPAVTTDSPATASTTEAASGPGESRLPEGGRDCAVAYFCMEIGLAKPHMPTYAGGLGILAGDTLRTAADMNVPMVGVSLLYRQGYFRQVLDEHGWQTERPARWQPEQVLTPLEQRITIEIEGRAVEVRAWRLVVVGCGGGRVPLFLLDTDTDANSKEDRRLTDRLYPADPTHRLHQQVLLGMGGVALLRALGFDRLQVYHMNEGHSALLAVALLQMQLAGRGHCPVTDTDVDAVRRRCVFTTHTPVPAAMDRYPWSLVRRVLGGTRADLLEATGCRIDGELNMTYLALRFSHYINGVAMRHGEVSRGMFPRYPIRSITNGVHAATWASPPFTALFDRHVPQWRSDNLYLRYAVGIGLHEIEAAHAQAKRDLLDAVARRTGRRLTPDVLTIGFARRATAYKRADLLFSDPRRLRAVAEQHRGLQIVLAGKAHPVDEGGKQMIRRIHEVAASLADRIPVVYLADYDIELARLMVGGVDIWLNTPLRPLEASGTSGMKAAINGVPSLSVADGWWIEGRVDGVTGWTIGSPPDSDGPQAVDPAAEAADLYDKLGGVVCPLYYERPADFAAVMRSTIALNGAFFNSQRMLDQYVTNAYALGHPAGS